MTNYKVIEGELKINEEVYTTYGIIALENDGEDLIIVAEVPDVSTNKEFVEKLARECSESRLSPVHLKDVVEDRLCAALS